MKFDQIITSIVDAFKTRPYPSTTQCGGMSPGDDGLFNTPIMRKHDAVLRQLELKLCIIDDMEDHFPIKRLAYLSEDDKIRVIDQVTSALNTVTNEIKVRGYLLNSITGEYWYYGKHSERMVEDTIKLIRSITRAMTRLAYLQKVSYDGLDVRSHIQYAQLAWEMNAMNIRPIQVRQVLVAYFAL